MHTDPLMRTSEYLDRLDPLRPALRRLAVLRFSKQEYEEFLLDLGETNGWRFSPTGQFLAAKCYCYLDMPKGAREAREEAWRLWSEIREYEDPICESDRIRLEASFAVLDAQIHLRKGEKAEAESRLDDASALTDALPSEDFSAIIAGVESIRQRLDTPIPNGDPTPGSAVPTTY